MSAELIFNELQVTNPVVIGEGQESIVYDIGNERVLKILKSANFERIECERTTYELLAKVSLSFQVPQIIEYAERAGTKYVVEKKLTGTPLSRVLETTTKKAERLTLLQNVFQAVKELRQAEFPEYPYGELISLQPLHNESWIGYFTEKVEAIFASNQAEINQHSLYGNRTCAEYLSRARQLLATQVIPKSFVHGDLWPPNILVEHSTVSAIIDINDQSLIGDSYIDLASLEIFLHKWLAPDEQVFVQNEIVRIFGNEARPLLNLYVVYYAFIFAGVKATDQKAYDWAIKIISEIDKYLTA